MTRPIVGKAFTFDEMIAEVRERAEKSDRRAKKGYCTATDPKTGKWCKRKHTGADDLCDKCRKEINDLLTSLHKGGGFFGIRV